MNFKKRVNGSWHVIPHYIHKTDTDTITTLPADIFPNAATATIGLKGNMSQAGTPTPQNPVMPNGTGERTGNLWNSLGFSAGAINTSGIHMLSNNYGTSLSTVSGGSVDITQVASGSTTAYQNGFFFIEIDISQFSLGDNIVISFDYEITNKAGSTSTTVSYVGQSTTGSNIIANWSESGRAIIKATITSAMTKPYVEIRLCGNSIKVRNVQINLGSIAKPYEPYGYKIPISSASTTTPIYLGEVETTRYIVKTVLTSNTNVDWAKSQTRNYSWYFSPQAIRAKANTPFICSHGATVTAVSDYVYGTVYCDNTVNLGIFPTNLTTVNDLKNWLDEQNANGTPVVIWNVLTTPTTAVVNEPLRKIGEYADEVANISIPVTAGGDTISVDTTLQPSEITVNYKGWHPAIVHEHTNGAWT